ncbi:MAG: hypothetical protein HY830_05605 [Actinobacteria bacterium]|nr:hypothetical protein [Actinomycetota bacterium]
MTTTTCCLECGSRPSEERPALLWSMSVREGHRAWTCSPCTRRHLHAIETVAL